MRFHLSEVLYGAVFLLATSHANSNARHLDQKQQSEMLPEYSTTSKLLEAKATELSANTTGAIKRTFSRKPRHIFSLPPSTSVQSLTSVDSSTLSDNVISSETSDVTVTIPDSSSSADSTVYSYQKSESFYGAVHSETSDAWTTSGNYDEHFSHYPEDSTVSTTPYSQAFSVPHFDEPTGSTESSGIFTALAESSTVSVDSRKSSFEAPNSEIIGSLNTKSTLMPTISVSTSVTSDMLITSDISTDKTTFYSTPHESSINSFTSEALAESSSTFYESSNTERMSNYVSNSATLTDRTSSYVTPIEISDISLSSDISTHSSIIYSESSDTSSLHILESEIDRTTVHDKSSESATFSDSFQIISDSSTDSELSNEIVTMSGTSENMYAASSAPEKINTVAIEASDMATVSGVSETLTDRITSYRALAESSTIPLISATSSSSSSVFSGSGGSAETSTTDMLTDSSTHYSESNKYSSAAAFTSETLVESSATYSESSETSVSLTLSTLSVPSETSSDPSTVAESLMFTTEIIVENNPTSLNSDEAETQSSVSALTSTTISESSTIFPSLDTSAINSVETATKLRNSSSTVHDYSALSFTSEPATESISTVPHASVRAGTSADSEILMTELLTTKISLESTTVATQSSETVSKSYTSKSSATGITLPSETDENDGSSTTEINANLTVSLATVTEIYFNVTTTDNEDFQDLKNRTIYSRFVAVRLKFYELFIEILNRLLSIPKYLHSFDSTVNNNSSKTYIMSTVAITEKTAVTPAILTSKICPRAFRQLGNKCLWFANHFKANFKEANEWCLSFSMELLSYHHDIVMQLLQQGYLREEYWIGFQSRAGKCGRVGPGNLLRKSFCWQKHHFICSMKS